MKIDEAISELKYARAMFEFNPTTGEVRFRNDEDRRQAEAIDMAIEALEFMEKYDAVWEGIKCAGEHGKEVELHRYGRVYRIREVAT